MLQALVELLPVQAVKTRESRTEDTTTVHRIGVRSTTVQLVPTLWPVRLPPESARACAARLRGCLRRPFCVPELRCALSDLAVRLRDLTGHVVRHVALVVQVDLLDAERVLLDQDAVGGDAPATTSPLPRTRRLVLVTSVEPAILYSE